MQLDQAKLLADIAGVAYEPDLLKSGLVEADRMDKFEKKPCSGFVASDEETVVLSFRGTVNRINRFEDFVESLGQWLTNFDFAQKERNGCQVHRGFDHELDGVYRDVKALVRDHGGDRKTLLVTGHSAGGALATLAARRLKEDGVPVDAAYVFASPRVGDERYSESYNVPLYRFEYMDDVVPHLPFSPSVMALFDSMIEVVYPVIETLFPQMMPYALRNVEYVHAGKLFFVDWNNTLVRSAGVEDILDDIFGEGSSLPGEPVPKFVLDVVRFGETAANIKRFLDHGSLEFFGHHHLSGVLGLFNSLLGRA